MLNSLPKTGVNCSIANNIPLAFETDIRFILLILIKPTRLVISILEIHFDSFLISCEPIKLVISVFQICWTMNTRRRPLLILLTAQC